MKPHAGVEPATLRLRVSRSTDWASEAMEKNFQVNSHEGV